MGRAVLEACREAIAQIKAMAAELFGAPIAEVESKSAAACAMERSG